jgi:hypothetical protein
MEQPTDLDRRYPDQPAALVRLGRPAAVSSAVMVGRDRAAVELDPHVATAVQNVVEAGGLHVA